MQSTKEEEHGSVQIKEFKWEVFLKSHVSLLAFPYQNHNVLHLFEPGKMHGNRSDIMRSKLFQRQLGPQGESHRCERCRDSISSQFELLFPKIHPEARNVLVALRIMRELAMFCTM